LGPCNLGADFGGFKEFVLYVDPFGRILPGHKPVFERGHHLVFGIIKRVLGLALIGLGAAHAVPVLAAGK